MQAGRPASMAMQMSIEDYSVCVCVHAYVHVCRLVSLNGKNKCIVLHICV